MDSFRSHKFTLGAEIGVAVGPYGGGAAVESGIEKAPVLSYVRTKGMYAGVELVGQAFFERFDENATMYHYPGVKAGEIVSLLLDNLAVVLIGPSAAGWQSQSTSRSGKLDHGSNGS